MSFVGSGSVAERPAGMTGRTGHFEDWRPRTLPGKSAGLRRVSRQFRLFSDSCLPLFPSIAFACREGNGSSSQENKNAE